MQLSRCRWGGGMIRGSWTKSASGGTRAWRAFFRMLAPSEERRWIC
jgi:hypothetical protein